MADTAIVGDFEIQFLAFFIEQNNGRAFDVEQRHDALTGELQQLIEVVKRGERLADLIQCQ
jgi:hypothetical protein